jgi:hypothetical protein
MDMNCQNGFLSEAINITFAAIEVSISVAYLIVASIIQVVVTGLSNDTPSLKNRVSLVNVNQKLKFLRIISIMTSLTILISILAAICNSMIYDFISIFLFILIIIGFTALLVLIINDLLKNSVK